MPLRIHWIPFAERVICIWQTGIFVDPVLGMNHIGEAGRCPDQLAKLTKGDAILAVPQNENLIDGLSHNSAYGNETYLIHPNFRSYLRWQQRANLGDLAIRSS
jgi:hypothetical protein